MGKINLLPLPTMSLRPAPGWVILELEESKYTGSLIIPETAKDAPSSGKVIAFEPDDEAEKPHTQVGDRVLFPKYSGSDVEWEGRKLLILKETEIICYITEE